MITAKVSDASTKTAGAQTAIAQTASSKRRHPNGVAQTSCFALYTGEA